MTAFYVLARTDVDRTDLPGEFVFFRDGFSWSAFLLGPAWCVWHRSRTGIFAWVLIACVATLIAKFLNPGIPAIASIVFIALFLNGLEAGPLRIKALKRLGWQEIGAALGQNLDEAEMSFFLSQPRVLPARLSNTKIAPCTKQNRDLQTAGLTLFKDSGR